MAIGKMFGTAIRTACAVLAVGALAPAVAAADVEPNNSVFVPEGPILGGQDITGTLSSGDHDDWYVLYADEVQQLHLTSPQTNTQQCLSVTLTDADGRPIAPDYTSRAGTTRFFVHVGYLSPQFGVACPSDMTYSFRVDPAAGLVPGPGKTLVKGTREPNETLADAGGPLLPGAWYFSKLETVNDNDWLHFYVRPGARRVEVETVTFGGGGCAAHYLFLTTARGVELNSDVRTHGVIERLTVNVRRGAELFVHSFGRPGAGTCVGASAVVQVGPEEAIMSSAEVRATCSKGRRGERRGVRQVAVLKRVIARAGGSPSRAQKRKLARDRRELKSARRLVAIYC